jgi:hypothetical protein
VAPSSDDDHVGPDFARDVGDEASPARKDLALTSAAGGYSISGYRVPRRLLVREQRPSNRDLHPRCDRVAIIREGRLAAVEKVADLRGRAYHHVSIEFDAPVAGAEFARIAGVSELESDGARVAFKASGALDPVVKAAARHTVLDMELTEPTLEEIFLTFYGRDGAA